MTKPVGITLAAFLVGILAISCERPKKAQETQTGLQTVESKTRQIVVEEVLDAITYNYLKVREGDQSYWIAISKQPVEVGQTYYFEPEGLMLDFESKNLGRTFDSVYFVSKFGSRPEVQGMAHGDTPSGSVETSEQPSINVEPAEDGQTIAQLYDAPAQHAGKSVRVRGVVIKFTPGIMNTNWAHIQDGTKSSAGQFDLTVTTDETLTVGSVVVLEGTLALDKDFGYGYKYDLLLEDAIQTDKKTAI